MLVRVAHLDPPRIRPKVLMMDERLNVELVFVPAAEEASVPLPRSISVTTAMIDAAGMRFESVVRYDCTQVLTTMGHSTLDKTSKARTFSLANAVPVGEAGPPRPMLGFERAVLVNGKPGTMLKVDCTKPTRNEIVVRDDNAPEFAATLSFDRWFHDEATTTRTVIKYKGLVGVVFGPISGRNSAQIVGPIIVDMYGSGGGLVEYRAALLASHGYTTIALAYFRGPGLPKTYAQIEFDEYFPQLFDFVENDPQSVLGGNVYSRRENGIVFVALSTGAEIALIAASLYPIWVRGVCSIVGSAVAWSPFAVDGFDGISSFHTDTSQSVARASDLGDIIMYASSFFWLPTE